LVCQDYLPKAINDAEYHYMKRFTDFLPKNCLNNMLVMKRVIGCVSLQKFTRAIMNDEHITVFNYGKY